MSKVEIVNYLVAFATVSKDRHGARTPPALPCIRHWLWYNGPVKWQWCYLTFDKEECMKTKPKKGTTTGSKGRSIRNAAAAQMQAATPEVQQQEPAAQQASRPIREVFVVTGGTKEKPVRENAALVPAVTLEDMAQYGASKGKVLKNLAMNLLAGTAVAKEFMQKNSDVWSARALKDEKSAWFKIAESKATTADIRAAWDATIASRKRYDAPTIIALSRAVRQYMLTGEGDGKRESPMERFAKKLLGIANDANLSAEERLRSIVYHLNEQVGGKKADTTQQQATGTHG